MVSNIFLFHPTLGEDSRFDYYFSNGLKPPTRLLMFWFESGSIDWGFGNILQACLLPLVAVCTLLFHVVSLSNSDSAKKRHQHESTIWILWVPNAEIYRSYTHASSSILLILRRMLDAPHRAACEKWTWKRSPRRRHWQTVSSLEGNLGGKCSP